MNRGIWLVAAALASLVVVSGSANADPITISVSDIAAVLDESSPHDNALARLAAAKVNEALEAEGFMFNSDELVVDGDIDGDEKPCTGFWSPGGSYVLTLDADTALSILVDNLSEPIVFSVTIIGSLGANQQFQLRAGVKVLGKCIRLAKDTISLSADADFNVTVTAVINMNPVLDESGAEPIILLSPTVDIMGDVNKLNADLDISGIGGTFNFWFAIPIIGPFINDTVANPILDMAVDLLDIEDLAQAAIDDASVVLQKDLGADLSEWASETPITLPPISTDTLSALVPLTLEPGLLALPVSADYYNENRTRLLYAFLIGDSNEVNDILTGAAACVASAALAVPGMDQVPIYAEPGGICSPIDVTDSSLVGPFFSDSVCTIPVNFGPLSLSEYCAESVVATPNYKLGNATGLSPDQVKWRPAHGASIDVSVYSINQNSRPYFKRAKYKTITDIIDGYYRDHDLIDYQCSDPDILLKTCGCNTNDHECTSCTSVYQTVCYRSHLEPPLGGGPADFPIPRGSGTCDLEMRVYKKDPSATGLRPLIGLHGGSWRDRGFGFFGLESIISHFTDEDYAVFVPFYRLTGNSDGNVECTGSNWVGITDDVEDALNWVRTNASAFGALNVPVRVVGQSAGGHLAAWLAVNAPSDVFAGWVAYAPTDAAHYITEILADTDVDPLLVSGPAARALRDFLDADLDNIDVTTEAVVRNSLPSIVELGPGKFSDLFITHGISDTLVPPSQSVRLCNSFSGDASMGNAIEFGGDPAALTYQQIYACEANRSQLRLYAEGDHAFEFCIPGLACRSGTDGSQAAASSGMRDAIEFLGGTFVDSDGDLVADAQDNCVLSENPDQLDADEDGFGNICDGDFNGDCIVNFADLNLMRQEFFSSNLVFDFTGDGAVNFSDLDKLRLLFFGTPGPSNVTAACQ